MPYPPLPPLSREYKDNVFKHQASSSTVPNFERLVFIGASVVHFNITHYLHNHFPRYPLSDLQTKLHNNMNSRPGAWGKLYKLRSQCSISSRVNSVGSSSHDLAPSSPPTSTSPRSNGDLFLAYVGALFLENGGEEKGFRETNWWIRAILENEIEEGNAESDDEDKQAMKTFPSGPKHTSPSPSPTQPAPNGGGSQSVATTSENGSNHPTSQLNELAMKKKIGLFWEDSASGLAHTSIWTVKLKFSGSEKEYIGTGSTKKLARAVAAESALKDLNRQS